MSYFSELDAARISPRAEWEREHFGPAVLPADVEEIYEADRLFVSGLIEDYVPDAEGDDLAAFWDPEVCFDCNTRGGHEPGCLANS